MHKSPEYLIWQQAKERCYNPKKASYVRYGGRGITMDKEWKENFSAFFRDMGARPTTKHTLERVDNDGPYAPGNCIWATLHEQYRNRRQTVWIEFEGQRKCQKDWCAQYKIDEATFTARLKRGWSLDRALKAPPAKQRGRNTPITNC